MRKFIATAITAIIGLTMIIDIGAQGDDPRLGLVFKNRSETHCGVVRDTRTNQATWFGSNGDVFRTQAGDADPDIKRSENIVGIILDAKFYFFMVKELKRLRDLEEHLKKQEGKKSPL